MSTSANNPNALTKTLATAMVLSVVGVLLMSSRLISGSAASQERIFENQIPAHIPIKIKIKKEKEASFKDLKNEKWLSEFELEVTNTGDKPIYFLYINLGTNVKLDGSGPEIMYSVCMAEWNWATLSPKGRVMMFLSGLVRPYIWQ